MSCRCQIFVTECADCETSPHERVALRVHPVEINKQFHYGNINQLTDPTLRYLALQGPTRFALV